MKERKKEDQRNSPLFIFFEVRIFRVSNSTQKKESRISSLGGRRQGHTKKGRFSSFAWLACVDAFKNKAQNDPFVGLSKKNQREHTQKKETTSAQIWWGAETPPARRRSIYATSRFPRRRRIRARYHFGGSLAIRVLSDRRTTRERCARRDSRIFWIFTGTHMTHVSPAPPPTFAFRDL